MAGFDYNQMVKPLLSASDGEVNKQDVPELVKAIVKSKEEILHHEEKLEPCYSIFCTLAADYLASNCHFVTIGGLSQTCAAAKILLQYLIGHVGSPAITVTVPSTSDEDTPSESDSVTKSADNEAAAGQAIPANCEKEKEKQITIHDKHYLAGLKALCRGSGALHRPDQKALTSALNALTKLQDNRKPKDSNEQAQKESRRSRSDPSAAIMEQLVSPVHDIGGLRPPRLTQPGTPPASNERDNDATTTEVSDSAVDMRNLFGNKCVSALQSLGGGEQLIDVCLKFPTIQKYTQKYKDLLEGKGIGFPTTVSEALAIKFGLSQMVLELGTVWRIVSLPLLEPLSGTRLQKLATIAMAVLLAALTVATAVSIITAATQTTSSSKTPPPPREDDLDIAAPSITEKALDLFNVVLNAVRSSTRAGGQNVQNLQLMGAWLLSTGLLQLLVNVSSVVVGSGQEKKEEKGRSPSKKDLASSTRINLSKVQQGFGVVCVALASQAITLITGLLEDVKVEGWTPSRPPEPARLDILESFTATERLARLFNSVPLNHLLFNIATVAYRKSCSLKRTQRAIHEGDTFSLSDSTTYYEDDFSEGSLGEEDDDSVIIGSWFEEPMTSGEEASGGREANSSSSTSSHANSQSKAPQRQNSEVTTLVPEKGEPHGFISLASHIFLLMDSCLVESECAYVHQCIRAGLAETHMIALAAIIRDIDKETSKSVSGSLINYLGPVLGSLYDEFSLALYRYTHNVIASGLLNEFLQNTLLTQLGVSPWISDGEWPLHLLPRTLSVLAQVLLLRQRKDKDELKCDSDAACVLIWQRVVNTLVKSILKPQTLEGEIEDLNVEHAQLLLFLFHSLQLMQKKHVLLSVANAVVSVSPIIKTPMKDLQLLHLSRLLLIFDYLMKNLYEAPQSLIEQIQWNLFRQISSSSSERQTHKEQISTSTGKVYHVWHQLEDNYHEVASGEEAVIKPCFYTLTPMETNTQDTPKLDGLACSFILATPDSLKYSTLYETLISLLDIGCQLDAGFRDPLDGSFSFLGLCGVQYTFTIAYRTLLTMPPSITTLEALLNQEVNFEGPTILHSLIWGPRLGHRIFNGWIKDGLVRQSSTTQKADALLRAVSHSIYNPQYDMKVATQIINSLLNKGYANSKSPETLTPEHFPSFSELFLLDAVIARLQVTLDPCQKGASDFKVNPEQIPISGLVQLIQIIAKMARWSLLRQMNNLLEEDSKMSPDALEAFSSLLATSGNQISLVQPCLSRDSLIAPLKTALDFWNNNTMSDFPSGCTPWKFNFNNDIIPSESYVSNIVMGHMASLSAHACFSVNNSLKHVMHTIVTFTTEVAGLYLESGRIHSQLTSTLVAIAVDATCDHVSSAVSDGLLKLLPCCESIDENQTPASQYLYTHHLTHIEKLLIAASKHEGLIDKQILKECGSFLEQLLETPTGRKTLENFLAESNFASLLLFPFPSAKKADGSSGDVSFKSAIPPPIIKFLVKLFQAAEKSLSDTNLASICSSLSCPTWIESGTLEKWLNSLLIQSSPISDSEELPDGWLLLQTLASYTVTNQGGKAHEISHCLLQSLVPLGSSMIEKGSEGLQSLIHLVNVMSSLASNSNGEGHLALFNAACEWVIKIKPLLKGENDQFILKALSHLLCYISDIVLALKYQTGRDKWSCGYRNGLSSPPCEMEIVVDNDSDWVDEICPDDEDSTGEDSDEENMSNRLCTFTLTQKEFMNQHWYHCHTCNMTDRIGVCTVCAKVCHRGHDVTYAKYGSFFCDCGAKDDGSCLALVKRSSISNHNGNQPHTGSSAFGVEPLLPSLRRRQSSPTLVNQVDKNQDDSSKHREQLAKCLESVREQFISEIVRSEICSSVLGLQLNLLPTIKTLAIENSAIGSYQNYLDALNDVYNNNKVVSSSENLMIATPGLQEGAFENVRLSYSGEQGQTIRQLVTSHLIHRVAMCVMASPGGKRQHLAVSHEKGKISVLQLSFLLKQQESAPKKKLTLTRLSSAPIPFTVLSITSNPVNDDFLAVCGLKDCHILTFSTSGSVSDHLVLHPQLETGNYIIKSIWLPGKQTHLALVTADFVKIYDLSVDSLSPQYFFQMPSGKIKDACFVITQDDNCHLVVIASSGYIYTQVLCEESSAKHGPFFVTNVLSVLCPDLKDSNGEVGGGGMSIYYSHALQLLCFSYVQGLSFLAPLRNIGENEKLKKLYPITLKGGGVTTSSANNSSSSSSRNASDGNSSGLGGSSSSTSKHPTLVLSQWAEVPGHPGIITCLAQNSSWDGNAKTNTPVVLMVKPDTILVQELRVVPSKSKITDMVVVRQSWASGTDAKTTLILLCEDGSLRIYNANQSTTDFWLSPQMQKESIITSLRPARKKKILKLGRSRGSVTSFPIDYFEHCTAMNDVEFGGNDLLQVYNVQQLKNRLNCTGMYIASTKTSGFELEVVNTDANMIIVGVRVFVGTAANDVSKIPTYMMIHGRSIPMNTTKSRWYDVPFTRDESIQSDKKIVISFMPSRDQSNVTVVETVKIYGKTKDDFGWPEEVDEFPATTTAANALSLNGGSNTDNGSTSIVSNIPPGSLPLSPTNKLLSTALEALDGCYSIVPDKSLMWKETVDLATQLLNLPLPTSVQHHTRSLLASLHPTKVAYHNHKDSAQLSMVVESLGKLRQEDPKQMDCEAYHRLIVLARNIAITRPQNLVRYTSLNWKLNLDGECNKGSSSSSDSTVNLEKTPEKPAEPLPSKVDNNDSAFSKASDTMSDSDATLEGEILNTDCSDDNSFLSQLVETFWLLHKARPCNTSLVAICQPGLTHVEVTVHSIIEIIHAFTVTSLQVVPFAAKLYTDFLLCQDPAVSFSSKQALIKALRPRTKRRRVFIPSPPRCSTPGVEDPEKETSPAGEIAESQFEGAVAVDPTIEENGMESLRSLASGGEPSGSSSDLAGPLMGGMLDLQGDADDAMMELAIALSLHEEGDGGGAADLPLHSGLEGLIGGLPVLHQLQGLNGQVLQSLLTASGLQSSENQNNISESSQMNLVNEGDADPERDETQETEHFSDTTASANGSDDDGEGSTAATDGGSNLMMASPAEQVGSGGSESGGSVVESIGGEHNISGRSSMYGDPSHEQIGGTLQEEVGSSSGGRGDFNEEDPPEGGVALHTLRIALLDALIEKIPILKLAGGVNSIPFFQVVLMLSSDLDGNDQQDKSSLNALLTALVAQLNISCWDPSSAHERSPEKEVQLIILRFLSVLMSRNKSGTRNVSDTTLIPSHTANTLLKAGLLDLCLSLLKSLLDYWKNCSKEQLSGTVIGGNLLKQKPYIPAPDMSPFFLRQYVKGYSHDIFSAFPNLLTDLLLRIPYQVMKLTDGGQLESAWSHYLCEYTMTQQTAVVRRQVRKLLLFICGSKDSYRQMRDIHALDYHMKDVKALCAEGGFTFSTGSSTTLITLPYDSLIQLIEHLKACVEIATSRTSNWQKYCLKEESILGFLLEVSCLLEEGVSPTILKLLQAALCPTTVVSPESTIITKELDIGDGITSVNCKLERGFGPGCVINVAVAIHPDAARFAINLKNSEAPNGDVVIHVNPRFDDKCIVFNHFEGGSWKKEERCSLSYLSKGSYCEITLQCADKDTKILLNGKWLYTLGHRMSINNTNYLRITGDVTVTKVTYNYGLTGTSSSSSVNSKRASSEESDIDIRGEDSHSAALVAQINRFMDRSLLTSFMHTFLLESNATSVRWQAHSLILAVYRHSSPKDQDSLLSLMWSLWPMLPAFGRKGAQFVDLLGYFSLKTQHCEKKVLEDVDKAVNLLHTQSQLLANHPNASLYNSLASLVEFDGYYLESEPCLVCNNPEVPFVNVKLSTLKVDSRFTTKTQLFKLVGSQMISRLTLRLADLKRTKMVRTLNIYCNNRSVQAVLELKNKPSMWHKAKKVTLSAGQTEVKVDFPLPIVACNLMFEYADFYENLQASSETLQCPRCSAAVPATPGVCGNCGENVYQCHKCRAINYDEKDPFLCYACGYCKYAKFDYGLQCRPCCAVDPIDNEENRQKAVFNIDVLLEKADRSYKQLQAYKPTLELLLVRITEQATERGLEEGSNSGTQVNRAIQQLAQKYCGDCKSTFDELSKIIQRVQASRKELVAFDRAQKEGGKRMLMNPFNRTDDTALNPPHGRCFGCAASTAEHCITLLRALSINPNLRAGLCQKGLIQDLLEYNLRRGTVQVRCEVRQLLCLLTKDDAEATDELNRLIMDRISLALSSYISSPDLASAVRHEMGILAALARKDDSCWEQRLRCVVQIFLMAGGTNASPMVMQHITLPCLRILQGVMQPLLPPPLRKGKEKAIAAGAPTTATSSSTASPTSTPSTSLVEAYTNTSKVGVNMQRWLAGDPDFSFKAWRKRSSQSIQESNVNKMKKDEVRQCYLKEKYGCRWLSKTIRNQFELKLADSSWMRKVLFNPSSRMARQVTAQMIESLCTTVQRKKDILDMLTCFLSEVGKAGESAAEFISLYQSMITDKQWKHYLALKGVLPSIANLITVEIQHLATLEETTLNTDLSQGYALKVLTELLSLFVGVDTIKRNYKGRLLGTVLSSYLSLRKLVVQRTKLIDDTQNRFLELLEDMTFGTEEETKEFMAVSVKTIKQYPADDLRTPVFIFERLCSIIYPEENDIGEVFLTLEKDPQQEDFLQGRMVGNPYSTSEPGLGPLMRDVKNKICHDCELVAFLEDDNGMELLVCNKIISLDLPIKEVYKKIWLPENNDCEAMRIVYRMRGLLGDATEEFVQTLDKKKEEDVDNEQVYRMAAVMNKCGGIQVMLECLQRISDLSHAKPLVTVLLKLFHFCVKIRSNREALADPALGAISVLLHTLKQCLAAEPEVVVGPPGGLSLTEQILMILEAILVEASSSSTDRYAELVETCSTLEDIHLLLNYVATSSRTNTQTRQRLMRVLPFLVFGHKEKMELLVGHFKPVLNFDKFDTTRTAEDIARMEAFCVFCSGIESNHIGRQLKDMVIRANIVKDALEYIEKHIPQSKKLVVVCDDEWKDFISKPSLKYILRILAGLAWKHPGTQQAVAVSFIPAIHKLEQISSDERVGSLAENLLEALKDDPQFAQQVQDTRRSTRQEKKQLAMKTRKKELERLGLKANEKEQITSESSLIQHHIEDITEESGLICAICLEGYRCQPQKVLAIYTFSKRCPLEEFENKAHKTKGYCTVSHFNVVHVDCHFSAVRASRGRDEWESAALHNANTRANGLLPLWGPQVPESAFASSLAKHNHYLQDCTTYRDVGYTSTLHDLKLLLLRFSSEKSFSDDSGGGGPQSNMNLIPYLIHMTLYVMNTTRSSSRELKRVESFLEATRENWVESFFDLEGPFFMACLAISVLSSEKWKEKKLEFLNRLLACSHARSVCGGQFPSGGKVHDKSVQAWSVYKSSCIFWSLVDGVYRYMFKKLTPESDWSTALAEFIRHNDQCMIEASAKMLSLYQEELIPCASFAEFCDVVGLLGEIDNPDQYLSSVLQSLP